MRNALIGVVCVACRGWHAPVPAGGCQPYALECACPYGDELTTDPDAIVRSWRCEAEDQTFDAVRRIPAQSGAVDTYFYRTTDHFRAASLREHEAPVDVCGELQTEEWWGEILACVDLCEHDPSLPEAEALPSCP